jgi:phosphoribosyl-ATP pyrophosphohydrolase
MAKDAKAKAGKPKAAKPKKKETKRQAAPRRAKPPKSVRLAEGRVLRPLEVDTAGADALVLDRLWRTIEDRRRAGDVRTSHSARLLARGTAKVAQKLGEEAVECVIEAAQGHRPEIVLESADVLYHLLVVWVDAGIRPEEVWAELRRREGISGIAEKAARPRGLRRAARTGKLP